MCFVVKDSPFTSPSTTATAVTGFTLLNINLASADPNRNSTLSPNRSASQLSSPVSSSLKHQASVIHSPQPSDSASPPQILDQDVIGSVDSFQHARHHPHLWYFRCSTQRCIEYIRKGNIHILYRRKSKPGIS